MGARGVHNRTRRTASSTLMLALQTNGTRGHTTNGCENLVKKEEGKPFNSIKKSPYWSFRCVYLPALCFPDVTARKLFVNQSRALTTHCTALLLAGVSAEKSPSTRSSAGESSRIDSTPHCLGMPALRNNLFHKFGALARLGAQFLAGVPTRQRPIDREVLRKRPKPTPETTNTHFPHFFWQGRV